MILITKMIVRGVAMLAKAVIVLFLIVIVYCLGSALYHLGRDKSDSEGVVKALTWRIALSIVLFFLLFVLFAMGWISPHTI